MMQAEKEQLARSMQAKGDRPAEQMETVHRDKAGRIVTLEEKLVNDKDRL